MKRMVLGLLIFSLISFSPVFAGKLADDESITPTAQSEGVKGVSTINKSIKVTEKTEQAIEENVDKSIFIDGTNKPINE